MILIPRDALVDTMHELSPDRNWTTSNTDASCPDRRKPQDIEQALVFGAHGPMSITVVLR